MSKDEFAGRRHPRAQAGRAHSPASLSTKADFDMRGNAPGTPPSRPMSKRAGHRSPGALGHCRRQGGLRAVLVAGFSLHEFARVILQFSAQGRVLMQKVTQFGVTFQIFAFVDKFRSSHQFVADVGMAIEEPIKAGKFTAPSVTCGKVRAINLEMAFALHKAYGVFVERPRRGGVVVKPLFNLFVTVEESRVVNALGSFPELFGDPGVIVQECVEAAELHGGAFAIPVPALGVGTTGET